jgi:hypothetical protein
MRGITGKQEVVLIVLQRRRGEEKPVRGRGAAGQVLGRHVACLRAALERGDARHMAGSGAGRCTAHGPGNAVHPLGTVVLPVTFGTRENYHTKFIKFEVATFESSYHAILGRPALAKFMAVPHYVYLLLKMPGLGGVLTLHGDLKKSYDCNQEAIQYASTTRVPDASGEVLAAVQQLSQSGLEIPSKKASKSSIQSTDDVALKAIQLVEGDSSKTAVIGVGLGDK